MVDPKKRDRAAAPQRLRMAAIGMEAECALLLDGQPTRPETLFGSPRDFIRGELMHELRGARNLRRAMVLREILGPPVGLR